MFERIKEFIYIWKNVSAVQNVNQYLKSKNEELTNKVNNHENAIINNSNEICRLQNKNSLLETEKSQIKVQQQCDYVEIDMYLKELEHVNRSGLDENAKRQNQNICINKIRNVIKNELINRANID